MGISDKIEAFILELMKQEEENILKIQRNELAQIFGCVPSQINYVISTRFNPEHGYVVTSRRGGGGCVVIRKVARDDDIGSTMTIGQCYDLISVLAMRGEITVRECEIMKAAVDSTQIFDETIGGKARAGMMSHILEKVGGEKND